MTVELGAPIALLETLLNACDKHFWVDGRRVAYSGLNASTRASFRDSLVDSLRSNLYAQMRSRL